MPLGTFGNCPVGVARAPGYVNLDLMLAKRIEVGGPRYAEFRIEAFNALNHPSFGPPGRDISVPAHVRDHHKHDQRAASGRAGVQVLLLILRLLVWDNRLAADERGQPAFRLASLSR